LIAAEKLRKNPETPKKSKENCRKVGKGRPIDSARLN